MPSSLPSPMGPAWDFASAAPSSNRMVAAYGLTTTARAEQNSTSPYPQKKRSTNDALRFNGHLWWTSRVLIFGRNKDADCHEVRVVREAGISVLFSFCDHLRLASLPIEHYDARHIIAVMIAPLQHAPE